MTLIYGRGHGALRRGRWSDPGAEYFLTYCTETRKTGLETESATKGLLAVGERLEREEYWMLRTAVIMPDHIHLLVVLGRGTELSAVIRLFKGRAAVVLRAVGLRWERGYFDHRLRANEDRLPVFRYILLNPHRAGLLGTDQKWPGYFCAADDRVWFDALTEKECPLPEWLL